MSITSVMESRSADRVTTECACRVFDRVSRMVARSDQSDQLDVVLIGFRRYYVALPDKDLPPEDKVVKHALAAVGDNVVSLHLSLMTCGVGETAAWYQARRSQLTSNAALARLFEDAGFAADCRVLRGVETPSVSHATMFEAIVGALVVEVGIGYALRFIAALFDRYVCVAVKY